VKKIGRKEKREKRKKGWKKGRAVSPQFTFLVTALIQCVA